MFCVMISNPKNYFQIKNETKKWENFILLSLVAFCFKIYVISLMFENFYFYFIFSISFSKKVNVFALYL